MKRSKDFKSKRIAGISINNYKMVKRETRGVKFVPFAVNILFLITALAVTGVLDLYPPIAVGVSVAVSTVAYVIARGIIRRKNLMYRARLCFKQVQKYPTKTYYYLLSRDSLFDLISVKLHLQPCNLTLGTESTEVVKTTIEGYLNSIYALKSWEYGVLGFIQDIEEYRGFSQSDCLKVYVTAVERSDKKMCIINISIK